MPPFETFRETGDGSDPAIVQRRHDTIYAAGGSRHLAEAYNTFRSRLLTPTLSTESVVSPTL